MIHLGKSPLEIAQDNFQHGPDWGAVLPDKPKTSGRSAKTDALRVEAMLNWFRGERRKFMRHAIQIPTNRRNPHRGDWSQMHAGESRGRAGYRARRRWAVIEASARVAHTRKAA